MSRNAVYTCRSSALDLYLHMNVVSESTLIFLAGSMCQLGVEQAYCPSAPTRKQA